MRILYLITRDPFGQASGRKAVFRTVLRSLERLGHDVELGVFDEPATATSAAATCHWFGRPGPILAAWRALLAAVTGRESLNEALYRCDRRREQVRSLARDGGFDLVIADMIRMAPYAAATDLPWILDLDDLLSERYRAYAADGSARESLLGYYGRGLPRPLRWLAQTVAGLALARERRLLERREDHWALAANAVTLVSAAEATRLAERTGRAVVAMPMSVDIPAPDLLAGSGQGRARTGRAVFVGGLDYQPNLDALRFYVGEVHPALDRIGSGIVLDVVGNAEQKWRDELADAGLEFRGYVDDIMTTLQGYRVFVAPLVSGSGIKTKVLEAMAAGLVVITTPAGIIGLDVRHGEHCLLARGPDEMATHLRDAFERPEELRDIGQRARRYVAANFSHEVLQGRWQALLAQLGDGGGCRDHAA